MVCRLLGIIMNLTKNAWLDSIKNLFLYTNKYSENLKENIAGL